MEKGLHAFVVVSLANQQLAFGYGFLYQVAPKSYLMTIINC